MSDSAPLVSVPSPTPPARTSKDVQADYNNLLFRIGVETRGIFESERQLKMFNESLDSLRLEYNQVLATEQKAIATTTTAAEGSA